MPIQACPLCHDNNVIPFYFPQQDRISVAKVGAVSIGPVYTNGQWTLVTMCGMTRARASLEGSLAFFPTDLPSSSSGFS